MTEAAIRAFGTQFQRGDGGTPTEIFTEVAEVTDITGPSLAANSIDVTSHDSPDAFQEFIQGLKDAGEVTLELNFIPTTATHIDILQDYNDGDNKNYKVVFPDVPATEWSFRAHVTAFEAAAPTEDQLTASVTFKLSGKPTIAGVV